MALTNAEKQKAFRKRQRMRLERSKNVMHFIDAFDDIALLIEQLESRLSDLKFCYEKIRARLPVTIGDNDVT